MHWLLVVVDFLGIHGEQLAPLGADNVKTPKTIHELINGLGSFKEAFMSSARIHGGLCPRQGATTACDKLWQYRPPQLGWEGLCKDRPPELLLKQKEVGRLHRPHAPPLRLLHLGRCCDGHRLLHSTHDVSEEEQQQAASITVRAAIVPCEQRALRGSVGGGRFMRADNSGSAGVLTSRMWAMDPRLTTACSST